MTMPHEALLPWPMPPRLSQRRTILPEDNFDRAGRQQRRPEAFAAQPVRVVTGSQQQPADSVGSHALRGAQRWGDPGGDAPPRVQVGQFLV